MLSANRLVCSRGGRVLFERLSLTVAPGAWVHVTGSNDAGKTTLLRPLIGLCAPDRGEGVRFLLGVRDTVVTPVARRESDSMQAAPNLVPYFTDAKFRRGGRKARPIAATHARSQPDFGSRAQLETP
jgi:ABC-type hemin transport system ATPase subunit